MDSKKVIETLVKIAVKQQKIINKLAQAQGLPPDAVSTSKVTFEGGKAKPAATPPPPTGLDPTKTQKTPAKAFIEAMTPQQQAWFAIFPEAHGNEMRFRFKPEADTDANFATLLNLLKSLVSSNRIQQNFTLKSV